jgi:MoaA/NifB/PqqE/SkfB family radical SAM enzyme
MSLKNMKKILDRLEEAGVQGVTFTGGGEPFINPETINGLEYAATKKFKTGIFTNGTLLTEEIIERLAKLKLNFIRISLNTAQRENYLKFHNINNPLIFEKVINNIKRFAQVLADSPTYFGIAAVINEQNVDLITSLSDLIKEILDGQPRAKIDYLTFRPVLNYGQIDPDLEKQISPLTAQRTICNYHLVQKSLAPYPVLLKFSGDYFNEASRASISFKKDYTLCLAHAWGGSIGYDGGLYLCSERDGDPDYLMGNLITQSLKKIWLSEQRRKVLNNIHDCPPACKMHRYNLLLHSLFKSKEMNDGKIDEILKKSDKIVRQSHFSFPGFLSW